MSVKREIVRLTGRVQGVGFRYQIRRIAQGFAVSGCVRNLRGGEALEIDVEGEPEEIERFIAAVLAEPPASGVVAATTRLEAEPRNYTGFEIAPTVDG